MLLGAIAATCCSADETSSNGNPDGSLIELVFQDTYGTEPRFSPDNAKLAFIQGNISAMATDVCVMTVDGTARTHVAEAPETFAAVSWTPDGARLVFSTDTGLGSVASSGGATTAEYDGGRGLDLDVSPDGNSVLVGGAMQIVTLGSGIVEGLGVVGVSPRFSPDGSQIAFMDDEVIKVMTVADGSVIDVVDAGIYLASVDWFPDGERLGITSFDGIEIVSLGSPPSRELVHAEFAATNVDVSPDGTMMAYTINGQQSIFLLMGL